jgi:signal transduction histidine kinase/ligand-binding sensor domain-containing protein
LIFGKKIPECNKAVHLLCFALFFSVVQLFAQPEGVALRHLTTDEGLSHNHVNAIVKDAQGFMWFGTVDGLTRFDGKRCTVFRPAKSDTNSLTHSGINGLALDPLGRMWVATAEGLCRWDYEKRIFHRLNFRLPGWNIPVGFWSISFDKNGNGWSVADSFLVQLDYRTLKTTLYPVPDKLRGVAFTFVDSKGRIWVNVAGNVFQFFPENQQFVFKFGKKDKDPAKRFFAGHFAEDEHGRVWCSSWGSGLYLLNEQTGEFDDYDDGPVIATVLLFDWHPDAGPIAWVGGGLYGLFWYKFRDGKDVQFPQIYKEPFSHNNTAVNCFFKDAETGIVWIGTLAGVEKYDPNDLKFTRIVLPDSITPDQYSGISGIVRDPKAADRYWITIWGKGMVEWNRREKKFKHYSQLGKNRGLYNDETFDIISDRHGKLWIAQYGCVQEFDPETKRFRTFKPDFPTPGVNHKILELLESRDGHIWLGSNYEGLFRLDPVSGHIGHIKLDGKKHYISVLKEDGQGRILFGVDGGFFRYDPFTDRYEHFLSRDSAYYACHDFAFDRDKRLWVATDKGLLRLDDNGRIEFALTTENGLPNNNVYCIEIDLEDRFWLSTSNGLVRYYPPTGALNVYRRPDGLFNNNLLEGFRMLPRGELFIGFDIAFNLANTARLPMNPHPPRVALTDVLVLNKPIQWRLGETIVLRPGDNVVAFDFAALSFTQSEKTVLAYKLEGFNEEWTETQQNLITYTNLDGGDYTLLVRARNGDGIWSSETARVQLKVIPPFTKTIWFRLMLVALVAGIVGLIAWYRQQQRIRLEITRRRIARDLHDDMGSTLSSIRFFSEVAQNQLTENQTPTKNILERIGQSATALSEAMQDIVWAINARHDNFDDLAARMREFGLKISEARDIRFSADIPASFSVRHLRPDLRRNIYLIFKEAVNNAAKYSGCSEINLNMKLNGRKLFLEIKDDGKGFDPATVQYGNGLANMRQRAADIKGKLEVKTAPGAGVKIGLEVEV